MWAGECWEGVFFFKRAVRGRRRSGVELYGLVASATLPPTNQVRDKHKDD